MNKLLYLTTLAVMACSAPAKRTEAALRNPIEKCRKEILDTMSTAYTAYEQVQAGECLKAHQTLSTIETPQSCNGLTPDKALVDAMQITNIVAKTAYEGIKDCTDTREAQ